LQGLRAKQPEKWEGMRREPPLHKEVSRRLVGVGGGSRREEEVEETKPVEPEPESRRKTGGTKKNKKNVHITTDTKRRAIRGK
jgi:hypothetical protein